MRLFIRASSVFAVVMAAVWILPLASAASPEAACIIARDAAIAKIKAMDKANTDKANTDKAKPASSNGDDSALLAAEEKARKGLEVQMRAILGPVAIKGLEGEGAINLDTLIEGDEDFGLLDGMVYGPIDAKTRVIVTTDGLLRRWLHQHKDWWGKTRRASRRILAPPLKWTRCIRKRARTMPPSCGLPCFLFANRRGPTLLSPC